MNLNELLQEVRYLIADTDSSNPKWTDTILTSRLNLGQLDFVSRTDCIRSNNGSSPTAIVSGTSQYAYPTGCLKLIRVSVLDANSQWKYLKEMTKEELDMYNERWEDDTSSEPTHYINELSNDNLRLYPTPNFSRASALRSEYVKKPSDLSSSTPTVEALDAQSNLEIFHPALSYYTAFLCKLDEKSTNEATNFYALYNKGVAEAIRALATRMEDRRILNVYETVRHRPLRSRGVTSNPFLK